MDTAEWARLIARTSRRDRPTFVAVDGEGIEGKYVLLAASGDYLAPLVNLDGISTAAGLDWLFMLRRRVPEGTRLISYGFNYDVQNLLRDLLGERWEELTQEARCQTLWETTDLRWIPRKYFEAKRGHHAAIVDDIAGFFGVSFIRALEEMGLEVPAIVREGKAARGEFHREDLPRVIDYNAAELRCMVALADRIAALCSRLQVTPNRWYGPSVLAGEILEASSLRHWRGRDEHEWEPPVQDALRRAYFGGRIETLWLGERRKPVFFYDLHSAYPAAMQSLPALTGSYRQTAVFEPRAVGVWRLRWSLDRGLWILPLPWRDGDGRVSFPCQGEGWYWTPEADIALQAARAGYGEVEVLDGYVFQTDGLTPMRRLVPTIYRLRADYKGRADKREYVLKIAMNSLYGKLAQSKAGVRGARHRSLIWAGWITSLVRRQLYAAAHRDPHAVLALATDGLITERPLEGLQLGDGLGEWGSAVYAPPNLLLGNGIYSLESGKKVGHRGLPPDTDLTDLFARLRASPAHMVDVSMRILVSHRLAALHPIAYGGKAGQILTVDKAFDPFRDHHRYWELPGRTWRALAGGWPLAGTLKTVSAPSETPAWVRLRNEELWCMVDAVEDTGATRIDYRELAVVE